MGDSTALAKVIKIKSRHFSSDLRFQDIEISGAFFVRRECGRNRRRRFSKAVSRPFERVFQGLALGLHEPKIMPIINRLFS